MNASNKGLIISFQTIQACSYNIIIINCHTNATKLINIGSNLHDILTLHFMQISCLHSYILTNQYRFKSHVYILTLHFMQFLLKLHFMSLSAHFKQLANDILYHFLILNMTKNRILNSYQHIIDSLVCPSKL